MRPLVNCTKDRYAEPRGVAIKMKLDAAVELLDNLKTKGLRQEELAFAFVSEWMRLNVESIIRKRSTASMGNCRSSCK